jgi:hypothetical protein
MSPKTHTQPEAEKASSKKQAKGMKARESDQKLSALDAAAKVLVENGEPMQCQQMIEVMAAKGYWKSPRRKTPYATLYAATLREIKTKGSEARFTWCELRKCDMPFSIGWLRLSLGRASGLHRQRKLDGPSLAPPIGTRAKVSQGSCSAFMNA